MPKELQNLCSSKELLKAQNALFSDVQNAYNAQIEKLRNISANNKSALNAMTLGLLNLIATDQLDKFATTQTKLLEIYKDYLKRNSNPQVIADNVTWDTFKRFIVDQNTEKMQCDLADKFGDQINRQLQKLNAEFTKYYFNKLHSAFIQELTDFLRGNDDGQFKNYKRFENVKRVFIRIRNSKVSDEEAIKQFDDWWEKDLRGKNSFYSFVGNEILNQHDFAIMMEYFNNIAFNLGADHNSISNYYTPGKEYEGQQSVELDYPAVTLIKEGEHWNINVDSNNIWLKVKSVKRVAISEQPTQGVANQVNKEETSAINCEAGAINNKPNQDDELEKNKRAMLIDKLKQYILRIESYKKPDIHNAIDFRYGFWFFKNSRATNREANYYLAKSLLTKLEDHNESIASIFDNIENQRNNIILEKGLLTRPDYVDRGINSSELNETINWVRSSLQNRPVETMPLLVRKKC